jgi:archaemetzincin
MLQPMLRALLCLVLLLAGCQNGATERTLAAPAAEPAVAVSTVASAQPPPAAEPSAAVDSGPAPRPTIYIQPLGAELPDESVRFVFASLGAFYDLDVQMLPRALLPDWALNQTRKRYRAEKLLDLLEQLIPRGGYRILGLTGVDISTTKGSIADWGILGLASIDGRVCIISSFRTGRLARNAEHARIRLGKTAVHEIGHTLGLPHCPTRGCLMEDAQGTVITTDREYDLCDACRAELARRQVPLAPAGTTIPWPRP